MFQNIDGEGFVLLTVRFWLGLYQKPFCSHNAFSVLIQSLNFKNYSEEKFLVKEIY